MSYKTGTISSVQLTEILTHLRVKAKSLCFDEMELNPVTFTIDEGITTNPLCGRKYFDTNDLGAVSISWCQIADRDQYFLEIWIDETHVTSPSYELTKVLINML